MSAFLEQLCSHLNIRLRPSSAFHPQTNGQTERMNATIKQLLRIAQYQDRNWLDVLDVVEMAVNNAPLVDSDFSPYYLNYGYHPTFYHDLEPFKGSENRLREKPRQFLDRLLADFKHVSGLFRKHQDRYVERANRKIKGHRFRVGDLVLVSARHHPRTQLRKPHRLAPKATGPYHILSEIGPRTFSLDLPARITKRFHNVFHESDLIPYVLRLPGEPEPPEAADEDPAEDPADPPPPGGP